MCTAEESRVNLSSAEVLAGNSSRLTLGKSRYTQMHYDRLTLYVHPPSGEAMAIASNRGDAWLQHESAEGPEGILMEQWHPVLESFPAEPVVLDYAAKVCMGDCAVVDAAARVFTLIQDWIVLLVVGGAEEVGLAKSWLCNVRLVGGMWNRTLVVSDDLRTVEDLFDWNSEVNVVHWELASSSPVVDSPHSDAPSIRLLSVIRQILEEGIPVMLAEPGCVWTADPLVSMPGRSDVAWDAALAWLGSQYSLSPAYFRPNEKTSAALSAISSVISLHFRDIVPEELDIKSTLHEIADIFTAYIRSNQDMITVIDLDPDLHAGNLWDRERTGAAQCIVPRSVCAEIIGGEANLSNTLSMMQHFQKWFVSNDGLKCSTYSIEDVHKELLNRIRCGSILVEENCGAHSGCAKSNASEFFTQHLDDSSTIYSFGTSQDMSYELGIAARYGASIHLFDTDLAAVEQYLAVLELVTRGVTSRQMKSPAFLEDAAYKSKILQLNVRAQQLQFHPYCLMNDERREYTNETCPSSRILSLKQIMKSLGHERIDLIKLNFELSQPQADQVFDILPKRIIACCNFSFTESRRLAPFNYAVLGGDGAWLVLGRHTDLNQRYYVKYCCSHRSSYFTLFYILALQIF